MQTPQTLPSALAPAPVPEPQETVCQHATRVLAYVLSTGITATLTDEQIEQAIAISMVAIASPDTAAAARDRLTDVRRLMFRTLDRRRADRALDDAIANWQAAREARERQLQDAAAAAAAPDSEVSQLSQLQLYQRVFRAFLGIDDNGIDGDGNGNGDRGTRDRKPVPPKPNPRGPAPAQAVDVGF